MSAGVQDAGVEIVSVSVMSCILTAAAISLVVGVMWGFMSLPTAINENIPALTPEGEAIRALGYQVLYLVPLLHLTLAISFTALAATLYNLVAGRFGGVVVRERQGSVHEGTWAIREIGVFPAMKICVCLSLLLMAIQILLSECIGWLGSFVWPLSWQPILYGAAPEAVLVMFVSWILVAVFAGLVVGGVGVVMYNCAAVLLGGVRVTARTRGTADQDIGDSSEERVEIAGFAPWSAARTTGAVGLGTGFMAGVITLIQDSGIFPLLGIGTGLITGGSPTAAIWIVLVGTVLYGIAGFIVGYVVAVLYNAVARFLGGATFVLKNSALENRS